MKHPLVYKGLSKQFFPFRSVERGVLLNCSRRNGMATTANAARGMEEYWKKNKRLNRPLSPHLTIYKPQITSMLSILNRATGAVLTGAMYVGPLAYLCGTKDYGSYLEMVKNFGVIGTGMIWTVKGGLAFSFSYHLLCGIRHLAWDWAMGFKLHQVTMTGYLTMGLTAVLTAALLLL